MSLFKLSNDIFSLGLDAQEMSVYAYLCSLPSTCYTLDGAATVSVKQSTIAEKCGIRAVQTVSKIMTRLHGKGLAEPLKRSLKANRHKGTYIYAVKHLPYESGYFFVDRHVFGMLIPRQMMIYLFICKSFSTEKNICWNSYNDISAQTGMKRELVIQTINELAAMHLIVRIRRMAKENNRMFVDNHYQIIFFRKGRIRRGKKMARLFSRTVTPGGIGFSQVQFYDTTFTGICQAFSGNFHAVRGSPSD